MGMHEADWLENLLSKMRYKRSGHFGVFGPLNRKYTNLGLHIIDSLAQLKWNIIDLEVSKTSNANVLQTCDGEEYPLEEFESIYRNGYYGSSSFKKGEPIIAIIDHFEQLPIDKQCQLVADARRVRQTEDRKIIRQLVICGTWGPSFFHSNYNKSQGRSPSFDNDKLIIVQGYDYEDIKQKLLEYCSITDELQQTTADFIKCCTNGDRELVDSLFDRVADFRGSRAARAIEKLLTNPHLSESLDEIIRPRIRRIEKNLRQCKILQAVLKYQTICLPENDTDCETLFLEGLLSCSGKVAGSNHFTNWYVSSFVASRTIFHIWNDFFQDKIDLGIIKYLMPVPHRSRSLEFEFIAKIENFLRNLIMFQVGFQEGFEKDPLEQLPTKERGTLPVYEAAREREALAKNEFTIDTLPSPTICYVAEEKLVEFISSKKASKYFSDIFNDNPDIKSNLEKFLHCRREVMHNKLYSVTMVSKLKEILTFFERIVGQAAQKKLEG